MISRTAEYALRAVVHLAANAPHEDALASQTLDQIAGATKVPAGYLSKVLQQLARDGIISSQRGLGGGFRLARPAQQISVYDVVQPVDPIERYPKCPLGLAAHSRKLCPLHAGLDAAAAQIESTFRATTIAELCAGTKTLCRERIPSKK